MKVLLYLKKTDEGEKRLWPALNGVVPDESIEVFHRIQGLIQYLCSPRPADDLTIAVFLAADHEDLQQLIAIRDLIINVRIILVLPDRKNETIAEGHTLQPRFITYLDSDFAEIRSVMSKMINSVHYASADRN